MTTDEKLQKFYDSTIQAASDEAEQIVTEYQRALNKLYEEHVEARQRRDARELADEKEKLKRDTNKAISAEQLEIRKKLSFTAQNLKDRIFADVERKLQEFKASDDYVPYLLKKADESLHQIPNDKHDEILFVLDPSDEQLLPEIEKATGKKAKLSDTPFIGGLKTVIPARHILVDNTFASLLSEEKETFTLEGGMTHA